MVFKRQIAGLPLLALFLLGGCEVPGLAFESAYPSVVCEDGGQRRVRVYGHGFSEGQTISAVFQGKSAAVTRMDDYTLDVYLPDIALSAEAFPWDPHDAWTGEVGLYVEGESGLEADAWEVLVTRSKLKADGTPDFQDFQGNALLYRSVSVDALVYDWDEAGEPLVFPGPIPLGYFTDGEARILENGLVPPGCGDGVDDYPGQFCYEPTYFSENGQPMLFDAGDLALWFYGVPWDPYLFKGALFVDGEAGESLYYYDGRDNETDYAPGYVYNQSFGLFYTLEPGFVYFDEGTLTYETFAMPVDGAESQGLSYVGMDISSMGNEFFPGILPITNFARLEFSMAGEAGVFPLQSPLGIISRDFDYSALYVANPYYTFTDSKAVDTDDDGVEDTYIPRDGSWECVWLSE